MKTKKLVALLMTAAITAGMLTACNTDKKAVPASSSKVEVADEAKDAVYKVGINVIADKGWDKDSTPAIVHITSKDKKAELYHAVSPGKDGTKGASEVKLKEGAYTVEFVSPLNKDGSAYDTGKSQEITVGKGSKDVTMDCPIKQIPADKVTEEMVKDIVSKTEEAVKKGDETLKGDKGKEVLDNLAEIAGNKPNVTEEAKKEAEEVKNNTEVESKPEETKKPESKPSNKNNNAGSNNTGSSNSGNNTATKPAEQPKPAHQHAWSAHTATRQVWVPKMVTVDDYEQQQVIVGSKCICSCGAESSYEHQVAHALAGEATSERDIPIWGTQNVKVGSHQEDHGSYQTESYTDYYYCSCGATK